MKVSIRNILQKEKEQVIIECVDVTPEVEQIQAFALSCGGRMYGTESGQTCLFSIASVIYFEAVDEHVFAYTKEHIYEIRQRLYEIEASYRSHYFFRCSKSIVFNLMALSSIEPAGNGRFMAYMKNGEKLVISRQYVSALKQIIMGKE